MSKARKKKKRTERAGTDCTPGQRRHQRNHAREAAFCTALAAGKSVAAAAAAAGIARRTVYGWRDNDAAFAAAWDDAWEMGTDKLEDLALQGAEQGSEKLLAGAAQSAPSPALCAQRRRARRQPRTHPQSRD